VGDGARAATTEVFEGVTVVETVLEEVDDLQILFIHLLVKGKGLKPSHKITSTRETFIQMCNKRMNHI
jgi:hypothetical protein